MARRAVSTVSAPRVWSACRFTGLWAYPTMATWLLDSIRPLTGLAPARRRARPRPGAMSSKASRTGAPRRSAASGPSSSRPMSRRSCLRRQLDVDQHERDVVEPGQERLAHDGPRADGAGPVDRSELEGRIGGATVRAHGVGRVAEAARSASSAATTRRVRRRRCPERRRRVVGDGYRAASPSSQDDPRLLQRRRSASHPYPSSISSDSVSSPCSGARRSGGACPSNCTGTAGRR